MVKIESLGRDYTQGNITVSALDGINLQIERGEFTTLAGPSGSGKTTLLNIIGALDRPTRGEVSIDGQKLSDMSDSALANLRRERIGFIFQSYNLIPVLTAYENAEFVLMLQRLPEAERRQRVYSILEAVGLKGLESRFPYELSGGQQQRVAVARAIVAEPAIVLADEPTANLDSKTAEALLETMLELNQKKNVTFVFSTHDRAVIEKARRVIYLKDGQIDSIRDE